MDDAVSEWVIGVHNHLCLGRDEGAALDRGENAAFGRLLHGTLKNGVQNPSLPPDLSGLKFAGSVQAGELGAGAGAARRAVVFEARTEDKILAVGRSRQPVDRDLLPGLYRKLRRCNAQLCLVESGTGRFAGGCGADGGKAQKRGLDRCGDAAGVGVGGVEALGGRVVLGLGRADEEGEE